MAISQHDISFFNSILCKMTQTQFILLYHDAVYQIVSGSLKGNKTKIAEIYLDKQLIQSVGGKMLMMSEIKAELRSVEDITDEEAVWFFKLYWGSTKIMRGDSKEVVTASKESFMHIVNGAWYISGDFEEMAKLHHEMRRYGIDVDGAIENGFAVNKNAK
jgi:hypothetical protein